MAYFFGDGFDLYALPADAINGYWDSGTTSNATLAAGRFSGSRGLSFSSGGGPVSFVKSSGVNDAVHHFVVAFQQTQALSGTTAGFCLELFDGATAQCTVVFRSDGAILLTSGGPLGTTLDTYTGAVTATSTWFAFEFEVVINNTTGSWAVRKNGNTSNDRAAGGLNTRTSANNYANKIQIGQQNAVNAQFVDDLLWRSDASSVPWVGDIRCYTRMPSTDTGAVWTRPSTFQMQPYFGATATQASANNSARYTPFTSQGGTIGAVALTIGANMTGNVKCAIYASTAGQPSTVIQSATAAITNPTIGTSTFTFSPAVSIAKGTPFFVAICADNATANFFTVATTAPYGTGGLTGTTTYASFPVANPTTLASTNAHGVFPVVTPAANADAVADVYEDSAASYVYSSNVGDTDRYTITSISGTPGTVLGVTTRGYFQKSDAGTRNVAVQLTSGGTTVESTSTALNTTWGWVYRNDLVDPATSAAWTATGVNNASIGATVKA
jgi:hypothetical protein